MKERDFQDDDEFGTFLSDDQSEEEQEEETESGPVAGQQDLVLFCSSCAETYKTSELSDRSDIRCPNCDDLLKEIGPESILEETIQIQNLSVPVFFENRYKLLETVGAGGAGYIFKVEDLELDRICALKLTSTLHADEQDVERFEREARLTARLNHENIIDIIDYGRSENTAYYSMTYIEGESLHELLQDSHVPPGAALKIIRNSALALHHAHLNSIIHRDIKPHNIMIVPKEEFIEDETNTDLDTSVTLTSGELAQSYKVVLMDFGLGKSLEQDKQLTRTGQIFGTPHYMSPEQARGLTDRVDERSDIYSTGVVLYQLLSNELPYDAETVNQLLKKISEEEPIPLHKHLPDVDHDLEAIVHKAIRKEPNRRYETALDFAQDCERFLRGEHVQAREPGLWYHFKKAIKQNRKYLIPAAAAVFALFLYLGGAKLYSDYQFRMRKESFLNAKSKIEKEASSHFQTAETHYRNGNYDQAVSSAKKVDQYQKYEDRGTFPEEEFDSYSDDFQDQIPFSIPNTPSHIIRAKSYAAAENQQKADLQSFRSYVQANTKRDEQHALLQIALHQLKNRQFQRAKYYFSLLKSQYPDAPATRVSRPYRAYLNFSEHRIQKALRQFKKHLDHLRNPSESSDSLQYITNVHTTSHNRPIWHYFDQKKYVQNFISHLEKLTPRKAITKNVNQVQTTDLTGDGKDEIIVIREEQGLQVLSHQNNEFQSIARATDPELPGDCNLSLLNIRGDNTDEIVVTFGDNEKGHLFTYDWDEQQRDIKRTSHAELGAEPRVQKVANLDGTDRDYLILFEKHFSRRLRILAPKNGKLQSLNVLEEGPRQIGSDVSWLYVQNLDDTPGSELIFGTGPWRSHTGYRLHIYSFAPHSKSLQRRNRIKMGHVSNGIPVYRGDQKLNLLIQLRNRNYRSYERIFSRLKIKNRPSGWYLTSINQHLEVGEPFPVETKQSLSVPAGTDLPYLVPEQFVSTRNSPGDFTVLTYPSFPGSYQSKADVNGDGSPEQLFKLQSTLFAGTMGNSVEIKSSTLVEARSNPKRSDVLLKGVRSFFDRNDLSGAEQYLKNLEETFPERKSDIFSLLEDIYKKQKNWKKLDQLYQRMITVSHLSPGREREIQKARREMKQFRSLPQKIHFDFSSKDIPFYTDSPLSFEWDRNKEQLSFYGNSAFPSRILLPVSYFPSPLKLSTDLHLSKMEWTSNVNTGIIDWGAKFNHLSGKLSATGQTNLPEFRSKVKSISKNQGMVLDLNPHSPQNINQTFSLLPELEQAFINVKNKKNEQTYGPASIVDPDFPMIDNGLLYFLAGNEGEGTKRPNFHVQGHVNELTVKGGKYLKRKKLFNPSMKKAPPTIRFLEAGKNFLNGKLMHAAKLYKSVVDQLQSGHGGALLKRVLNREPEEVKLLARFYRLFALVRVDRPKAAESQLIELLEQNAKNFFLFFQMYFPVLTDSDRNFIRDFVHDSFNPKQIQKILDPSPNKKLSMTVFVYLFPELTKQLNQIKHLPIVKSLLKEHPSSALKMCKNILNNPQTTRLNTETNRENQKVLAKLYRTMGDIYRKMDQLEKALTWYRKAKKICPSPRKQDNKLETSILWIRSVIEERINETSRKISDS